MKMRMEKQKLGFYTLIAITILAIIAPSPVNGRKTFLVKEHHKNSYHPRLMAYDGSICPGGKNEDYFCVDHNT